MACEFAFILDEKKSFTILGSQGSSPDKNLFLSWLEKIPDSQWKQMLNEVRSGNKIKFSLFERNGFSGSFFEVSILPVHDEVEKCLVIVRNIAEEVERQRSLLECKSEFIRLQKFAGVATIKHLSQTKSFQLSHGFFSLFFWPKQDPFQFRKMLRKIHPQDRVRWLERWKLVKKKNIPMAALMRIHDPRREERYIQVRFEPVRRKPCTTERPHRPRRSPAVSSTARKTRPAVAR